MTDNIDKSIPIPPEWRGREPVSARKLNKPGEAIERMVTGAGIPSQVRKPPRPVVGDHEQFILVATGPDYLVCYTFHAGVSGSSEVVLAKPFLLRRTDFEEDGDYEDRDDKTYLYLDDEARIVKDSDGYVEYEEIDPPYLERDIIYGTGPVAGGTYLSVGAVDVLRGDANFDARRWCPFQRGAYVWGGMSTASAYLADNDNFILYSWFSRESIPSYGRAWAAAIPIGGAGWLCGGEHTGSPEMLSDTLLYKRTAWSHQSALPAIAALCAGGYIGVTPYVIGGRLTTGSNAATQAVYKYSPATSHWVDATYLPDDYATSEPGTASIDDRIYVFGGGGDIGGAQTQYTWRFDGETWTGRTNMPSPARVELAAANIGHKAYVVGGWHSDTGRLADCDEYDTVGDSWATGGAIPPDLSTATHELAAFSMAGDLYVCGGRTDTDVRVTDVFKWQPASASWSTAPSMPDPARNGHTAITIPANL